MSAPAYAAEASSNRHVWRLAWPTIVSNLLFTTVGFLHIKIVSELGTESVAAVTSGHRVFFLVQAILMGMTVAATAMIARAWGASQAPQAERVAWTSLVMAVALAAVLAIPVVLFPQAIASLFGLDAVTTSLAATFIFWMGVFNIFTAINMMLGTALRAIGDMITPLFFLLFSSALNILMAYTLAFGFGPFPAMGVAGVSLGGSLGASIVTVAFAVIWWRGGFDIKRSKRLNIDWNITRQLIKIGAPSVLEQGIVQLAFLAFFAIIAQYGTAAFAAYGIGISLVAFSIVIGFGFGIATATLVGQQLGAGQPELAVVVANRSLRMAFLAMTLLSVVSVLFAEQLSLFMIDDLEVVELTVVFIYFIALAQPMMAFEFTLGGALRGAGDTRSPLVATFCGIIFGRLIPALVFLWLDLSVYWIFAVMLFDYAIKATLLYLRFRSRTWLEIDIDLEGS
ncbi:MAG: MATE family efflux transporter [Pseudomonadota bacterium]